MEKEIIDKWLESLKEDTWYDVQMEKLEREADEKFLEMIMTGKTTYHITKPIDNETTTVT